MADKHRSSIARKNASRLLHDECGATAVEYGLMIAVIAAVIITVVISVGAKLNGSYTFLDGQMDTITQP